MPPYLHVPTAYRWQVVTSRGMHTSAEVCHELKRAYHGCLFAINTSIFTQVYRLTRQCLGFRYENLSISGQLRGLLTWVRCHHGCVREEALRPTVLKGLYGVNTAIRLQRPDTGLTDRTHGDLSFFLASPASPAGWPPTSDDVEYSIPALQYST